VVVPLVQPDRRLVQHVEHADEPRADLGGQPDALRLATRERARGAVQREVVQADVEQEAQPGLHLLEHRPGDHGLAVAEPQPAQELRAVGHRQRADVGDGLLAVLGVLQGDGEDLGLEPGALARGARHLAHVALVLLPHVLRLGGRQPAVQERHHALVVGVVRALAAVAVVVAHVHLVVGAVQHDLLDLGRQPPPRGVHPEADAVGQRLQQPGEVIRGLPVGPGRDGALAQRQLVVGHHELGVDLLAGAQARARLARAVRGVERERAGLQVVHAQLVPVGAGHPLGEAALAVLVVLGQVHELQHHDPVGQPQTGLHRVGEPLLGRRLDGEPVDHDLDVVLLLLLQLGGIDQRVDHAVHPDPRVALRLQGREQVGVLPLAAAYHGSEHLEPGALDHRQHLVHDLLGGLLADRTATLRAVRPARPGVQQPQVVIHLGDGADRRARVAAGGLLVDRDGRRQALDEVDVRLVHLAEELAGVGGQRLDVAPLALREDGVEGQAGLA
jgi:hypothetical protein